ncbi:MAG: OmpH family outer membrane protein [Bacillota bacterium]
MKKNLIFSLLLILSIALIITNPINAEDEVKQEELKEEIGYVDMQKLFENHPQKESSEQKLEGDAKKFKEELETKGKTMDKEERQELLKKYQEELNSQEQELIDEVLADINEKIRKVADEQEISIILDKSAVIYGGYNLTSEVLAEMEE